MGDFWTLPRRNRGFLFPLVFLVELDLDLEQARGHPKRDHGKHHQRPAVEENGRETQQEAPHDGSKDLGRAF